MTQEPRFARRHLCNFSVTLTAAGKADFVGVAADISTLGIAIHLERATVTDLAQGGNILTAGDLVSIRLPTLEGLEIGGHTLSARVRHVRRLSLAQYRVGCRFVEPDGLDDASVRVLAEASG